MRQDDRQHDRTDAAKMYSLSVCWHCIGACESVRMGVARKLSLNDAVLLDRLKLILAISGAGVNTGGTPTEPRQANQAEDR